MGSGDKAQSNRKRTVQYKTLNESTHLYCNLQYILTIKNVLTDLFIMIDNRQATYTFEMRLLLFVKNNM